MNKVLRFWCHDASNIRCVREEDYDTLQAELIKVREESCNHLSDSNNAIWFIEQILESASDQLALTHEGRELMRKVDQWAHGEKIETDKAETIHIGDLDPAQRLALARGERDE